MPLALRTEGVTKRYGPVTAVDGVSLAVRRGEVYGFLGLNGAGKTTTIRLLLGMIRPSGGYAEVLGERVRPGLTAVWHRVGYHVEAATAYPELTVRENLEVAALLHRTTDPDAVDTAIGRLRLGPYADRRAGTLSAGNFQRLALARALLHSPELLILDEPTVGLDPAGVVEVRQLIRDLARDRGVTVFMSSHILTEVARLATRIGVIHHGRLVQELDAGELERLRARRLEVTTRDAARAAEALARAGFEPAPAAGSADGALELREERAIERPDEVARVLVEAGAPPTRLVVLQDDLEEYFLRLTGTGAPDAAAEPGP